jgi:hypothetical protein
MSGRTNRAQLVAAFAAIYLLWGGTYLAIALVQAASLRSAGIRNPQQKRKCPGSRGTSVLPSGADIVSLPQQVRLVPFADIAAPYSGCQRTSTSGFGFSLTGQMCNSHRLFPSRPSIVASPNERKTAP